MLLTTRTVQLIACWCVCVQAGGDGRGACRDRWVWPDGLPPAVSARLLRLQRPGRGRADLGKSGWLQGGMGLATGTGLATWTGLATGVVWLHGQVWLQG